MPFPLLTRELTAQITDHHTAFARQRMQVVRDLPGNPYHVEIARFGSALAIKTQSDRINKNTVFGLDADSLDHLDNLLAYYRKDGLRCAFSCCSDDLSEHTAMLIERGVYPTGDMVQLIRTPEPKSPELPDGMTIRLLAPEETDVYLDLYFKAHGTAPDQEANLRAFEEAEHSLDGYRRYLLECDGIPAAIAAMFVHDGVAGCFNATTLHEYRGRGCQSALISWRLDAAAREGCRLAMASAARYATSHHNLERAGFRYVCFGSTWRDLG